MKPRVFLDTNVFIYAFEFPESNCAKIIDFLNKGEIEAVISPQVLKEVTRYFEKFHALEQARIFRRYLLEACLVIPRNKVLVTMKQYQNKIKEKDLEQLATVKRFGIKFLIALDRDFAPFEEYMTPKAFVFLLGIKPHKEEY